MQDNKILIFTATFNEKDNIIDFLTKVKKNFPYADILVVDDNSPDGTSKLINSFLKSHENVKLIKRPGKLGLGSAHILAMKYALNNNYDYLFTMDADLSHNPEYLNNFLQNIKNYDFLIGSRYAKGGKCLYKGYRLFLSKSANTLAKFLLGIKLNEFTTSFRLIKLQKLKTFDFNLLSDQQGYTFFLSSVYYFFKHGLKMTEVPITFEDRASGISKIPKLEIFNGAINLIKLIFHNIFYKGKISKGSEFNLIDSCLNCSSKYNIVKFSYGNNNIKTSSSDYYNCTSMSHGEKPDVIKCLECGLSQIKSSIIPSNLLELYKDVSDEEYFNSIDTKVKTFERAYNETKEYINYSDKILEIGSYYGIFLNTLYKKGFKDIEGIEPSRTASEYSNKHYKFRVLNKSFENIDFHNEYNAIFSWDVFEHVLDPNLFLQKSNKALKKNGILTLSTIDIDSRFAKVLGRRWPWIMNMHLLYFGDNSIENMFSLNNFEVISIKHHSHYASLNYAFKKFVTSMPKIIHKTLLPLSFLVPKIKIPFSFGDVKIYVLRKIN